VFARKINDSAQRELGSVQESQENDDQIAHEPTLPPHVAAYLGEQLKAYYSHLTNEPVPDRFVELLEQLGQDGGAINGS
jgi:hypothetical protein